MSQLVSTFASSQMQNVYTPLPFAAHLVFCVIASAVYCTQYYRKNAPHYLLLALAVDGTFLTQISTDSIFIMLLGMVEFALLIAAGVFAYRYSKEQKEKAQKEQARKERAEKEKARAEDDDDADEEEAQEDEDDTDAPAPAEEKEDVVDKAFDD